MRGYAALKLCEQSYKTVTSHIMANGPADVGSPLTLLSAMSISPVQNSMNSIEQGCAPRLTWIHGRSHGPPHPERDASLS